MALLVSACGQYRTMDRVKSEPGVMGFCTLWKYGKHAFASLLKHAGEPIRLPWYKHNAHLLLFTWKMFILTDLTNIHVPESICRRI